MRTPRWTSFRIALAICGATLLAGCGSPAAEPAATTAPVASQSEDTISPSTPSPTPTASAPATPSVEPSPGTTFPADLDPDSPESLTVVVNKLRPMHPQDFEPELVAVSTGQEGGEMVRPELDAALTELDAAMQAAIGQGTYVTSSYRSASLQAQYYQDAIDRYGQEAADTTSARPGHSEHQTGLAIDLMSTTLECRLNHCFGETAAGRWLAEHAWEHGFIVRYPEGADAITGYAWEPWHLRFVGQDAAAYMHEHDIATLEELAGVGAAPEYAS